MKTETYNGWTNRETWLANLWLTNDQGIYEMVCERVFQGDATEEHEQVEILRDIVEDLCFDSYEANAGLGADFLGQCLREVNYYEIRAAFGEGLDERAGEVRG
jgi:hypothetical protein